MHIAGTADTASNFLDQPARPCLLIGAHSVSGARSGFELVSAPGNYDKENHMIRNLKVLGLALVALLAMTAVAASAASAAPEFHGEKAPVVFEGSQTEQHVFTTNAGTVKCTIATFSGENATTTSTTATLTPKYEKCTAFGFLGATVDVNACSYTFHLVANSSPATATVDINCPAGKTIDVTSTGCVLHVPAQAGLSHVTFANTGEGTARDVDATINIGSIKYTQTSGCLGGEGTFTNGTYKGTATVKGVGQGIWVA